MATGADPDLLKLLYISDLNSEQPKVRRDVSAETAQVYGSIFSAASV